MGYLGPPLGRPAVSLFEVRCGALHPSTRTLSAEYQTNVWPTVPFSLFCAGARIKHKGWLGMYQYEESRGRWLRVRPKRTAIDTLKLAAALGSLLAGLVGSLYLFATYPHPH